MRINIYQQRGLSLIEMMIATAIGLLLLAGISSLSLTHLFTSTDTQRSIILQEDAQAILALISRDLRRAGYHPLEEQMPNMRKIWLLDYSKNKTCLLYRYHNPDFPDKDAHGFQYTASADGKGFIKMLTSNNASGCDDGTWQELNSNRNMLITQFSITPYRAFEKVGTEIKEVITNLDIDLEATDNTGKLQIHLNQDIQLRNRPFLQ
ncbi:PilW family protein [Iodobacter sp.]|uniref:PilW family protein n=1 Tax=Iodobacter sp. TaxID=1915058 RepID=UPI0025FD4705|nr:prepilin-type N-terminal cleavage/methylation domain-containing protein [Iodobacter sp.]